MVTIEPKYSLENVPRTKEDYLEILNIFDNATCEAISVGQEIPGRLVDPHIAYGTYIFSQINARASIIMRAAPHSRWVQSDFEDWHFSSIAGHARSMLEGILLLTYLMSEPKNEDELRARVNLLYLYDCTTRLKFFTTLGNSEEIISLSTQQTEISLRLTKSIYFNSLSERLQKKCLTGSIQMFLDRDEALVAAGFEKKFFDTYFDLLSQNIHILSMGYLRMETNGRGTGVENEADRSYISAALLVCTNVLIQATDLILQMFPDAASARKGIKSQFSPGPKENAPNRKLVRKSDPEPLQRLRQNRLSLAICKSLICIFMDG